MRKFFQLRDIKNFKLHKYIVLLSRRISHVIILRVRLISFNDFSIFTLINHG